MKCPKCNSKIQKNATFCPECGTSFLENENGQAQALRETEEDNIKNDESKDKSKKRILKIVIAIILIIAIISMILVIVLKKLNSNETLLYDTYQSENTSVSGVTKDYLEDEADNAYIYVEFDVPQGFEKTTVSSMCKYFNYIQNSSINATVYVYLSYQDAEQYISNELDFIKNSLFANENIINKEVSDITTASINGIEYLTVSATYDYGDDYFGYMSHKRVTYATKLNEYYTYVVETSITNDSITDDMIERFLSVTVI